MDGRRPRPLPTDRGLKRRAALAALGLLAAGGCTPLRGRFAGPDILFVATPEAVSLEMLRVAEVTAQDVVFDLGSGDGRIVVSVENPGQYDGPRAGSDGVPTIERRLALAYGGEASLRLEAVNEGGNGGTARTRATIELPKSGPRPGVNV